MRSQWASPMIITASATSAHSSPKRVHPGAGQHLHDQPWQRVLFGGGPHEPGRRGVVQEPGQRYRPLWAGRTRTPGSGPGCHPIPRLDDPFEEHPQHPQPHPHGVVLQRPAVGLTGCRELWSCRPRCWRRCSWRAERSFGSWSNTNPANNRSAESVDWMVLVRCDDLPALVQVGEHRRPQPGRPGQDRLPAGGPAGRRDRCRCCGGHDPLPTRAWASIASAALRYSAATHPSARWR